MVRVFDLRTGRTVERNGVESLALARSELQDGRCIICPTDTVFGLLADARNAGAVARIADIKGRSAATPPPVLVDSVTTAQGLVESGSATVLSRIAGLWPGPLSIVVTAEKELGCAVNPGGGTVALRVPADDWLRTLCKDLPLAASSANRHGEPTPTQIEAVIAGLIDVQEGKNTHTRYLRIAIDRGVSGGIASTVLDATVDPPEIIRHGALACELIRRWLPELSCIHRDGAIGTTTI